MKYKIYYGQNKCKIPGYLLNMITGSSVNLAEYIRDMEEPTIKVDESNNYVTMTFEPIPADIAAALIADDKLRFQVVRHKANSRHTSNIDFPYEFEYAKYQYDGVVNVKYGLSIPNNGNRGGQNLGIVTRPTLSELTSGVIERDMSGLFDSIRLHKCQTHTQTSPFVAEFYFGFIYWESFSASPDIFKMGYYSREE